MSTRRRLALMIALIITGTSALSPAQAQAPGDFDPIATAKLRAGEVAREITGSARDPSVPEPSRDDMFNTGLLLQAGLRALLPVQERQGVALPGTPSPKDPPELITAQENYRAVFASGGQATPAQRATAIRAIELAAQQLQRSGYALFARRVTDWLRMQ